MHSGRLVTGVGKAGFQGIGKASPLITIGEILLIFATSEVLLFPSASNSFLHQQKSVENLFVCHVKIIWQDTESHSTFQQECIYIFCTSGKVGLIRKFVILPTILSLWKGSNGSINSSLHCSHCDSCSSSGKWVHRTGKHKLS